MLTFGSLDWISVKARANTCKCSSTEARGNRPLFRKSKVFINKVLPILKIYILWTLKDSVKDRGLAISLSHFCVVEFAYLL